MTPEEHIEKAEGLLNTASGVSASVGSEFAAIAAVHLRIAEFKKKYPPEGGRPIPKTVTRVHNHPSDFPCLEGCTAHSGKRKHSHSDDETCLDSCPAYGTDSGWFEKSPGEEQTPGFW